jgi:alpha-glucosidase
MYDTLRFWLDRGVDGFRMDVIHLLGKDFADDPAEGVAAGIPHVPYNDVDTTHEYLREIRTVLDEYDGDRTSVGEVYLFDPEAVARYYGQGDELHLSFNFGFTQTRWTADALRKRIESALATHRPVDAWPTWVFSNHDIPRHRTRFGGDERVARAAAVLLLTLPGTPFLYAGEELGLLDAEIPPHRVVDPGGRDGCRAPLPWSDEPGHGWPDDAWLPLAPEADERNVETQRRNLSSILHLYREVLALRRATPALHEGDIDLLDAPAGVLLYVRHAIDGRTGESDRWLVAVNTTGDEVALGLTDDHQWVLRSEAGDVDQTDVLPPWSAGIAHVRG